MKTKILLFTVLLAGMFISCTDTDDPLDDSRRETPLDFPVDMDDNGVVDFVLVYNTTMTNGQPEEMIGYIKPLGTTQILTDPSISQTLFLGLTEYVTATPLSPKVFATSTIAIIRKRTTETTWTVNSISSLYEQHMNPAYIGVKFMTGDVSHVGWVKIQFNINDGEPSLVAKSYDVNNSGSCLINQ